MLNYIGVGACCLSVICTALNPNRPNLQWQGPAGPLALVWIRSADCAFAIAIISAMQLFVRCGCPVGSVSLDCAPSDTVLEVKDRLCARTSGRLGKPDLMVRSIRNLRRLTPAAKVY